MDYDFIDLDSIESSEGETVEQTSDVTPLDTNQTDIVPPTEGTDNTDTSDQNTPPNVVDPILPKPDDIVIDKDPLDLDSNKSTLSVFAQTLKESGVFASIEDSKIDGVKSVEDLLKLMDEAVVSKKYQGLTPTQQRYLESLDAGVSKSDFDQIEKEIKNIEGIDEAALTNNKQLQFNIIALSLIEQGIEKVTATKLANSIVAQDDSLTEALEYKQKLYDVKLSKYNSDIEAKKQDTKLSVEKTKELVDGKEMILGSIPLTKNDRDQIFSAMTTKVDITESGDGINRLAQWRKEQGVEAELMMNALFVLTKEFKDFSRLGEVAKTKAAMLLEQRLRESESVDYRNPNSGFELGIGNEDPYNINV